MLPGIFVGIFKLKGFSVPKLHTFHFWTQLFEQKKTRKFSASQGQTIPLVISWGWRYDCCQKQLHLRQVSPITLTSMLTILIARKNACAQNSTAYHFYRFWRKKGKNIWHATESYLLWLLIGWSLATVKKVEILSTFPEITSTEIILRMLKTECYGRTKAYNNRWMEFRPYSFFLPMIGCLDHQSSSLY